MKILYILGAYKPRASANGLCSDNIIEHLLSQGHEVTVLANEAIGCKKVSFLENGLNIYRVRQRVFLRLKEWGEINQKKHPFFSKAILKLAFMLNKIQLLLTAPVWPRISPATVRRFKKSALKLCSSNKYDTVICVYTPIEALLAGYAVKEKYPEITFIPYFLDSLSGGYGPKYFSKQAVINRGLKIEKKVFSKADKIVLMKSSEEHQLANNREFSDKICFLDIPMLTKIEAVDNVRNINEKIKLLFIGSISPSVRNPDTLISSLAEIDDKNIECEFVGGIECLERFEPLRKSFGQRLKFTGFISHEEISEKIKEADILLNIGNLVETMVPSKIFEYMSFGKPIISTYDIENEPSKKYLSKYPYALLLDGRREPKENAKKIRDFLLSARNKRVEFEEVERLFYLNTPTAFTDIVLYEKQERRSDDRVSIV